MVCSRSTDSVVKKTDRHDMTIVVDWDVKPQSHKANKNIIQTYMHNNPLSIEGNFLRLMRVIKALARLSGSAVSFEP